MNTPLCPPTLHNHPAKMLQLTSPSDKKKSLVDAVALLSSDDGLPVHLKTIIGHLLKRATLAHELIQRISKLEERLEA
ncbi:unnamed protein product [Heligmosomoides polygyrus]|uniref:Uncharacterized protein n=1 Tax=Heligmosomoides polygyrus TaxID=6339 RepID=A0A183F1T7_HELPZ|nr:unnamed protein product [Heligmosomoides polygyrus]